MGITSHNEDGSVNWVNLVEIVRRKAAGETLQDKPLEGNLAWTDHNSERHLFLNTEYYEHRIKPERPSVWVLEDEDGQPCWWAAPRTSYQHEADATVRAAGSAYSYSEYRRVDCQQNPCGME